MPARAEEVLESIAANVVRLRTVRGYTQEVLAEHAGLDLRYLQRVERAKVNLSVAVLVQLADALEVAPGRLFRPASLPPARRGRPPARRSPAARPNTISRR
ncbi:helix-turn-helix domain-containing protein [Sandaracinus amylolyticus]|uniref:helix-turn-helix domain-containing protein n=1 Tax=Sandaracinus amylolyticus TaxID=927083 RepID=UPI001F3D20DD|nr:helix-turn-helix transcriptional regulator [Sandaracinus amylolyticus]UJR83639.1 Hypothetical protein I5071_57080 [Sandaracinus amylolyticus]